MIQLNSVFVCPTCNAELVALDDELRCRNDHSFEVIRNVPRFVRAATHENFSLQWNTFWDVQLDSRNGTTLSRDRLLEQSGLRPEYFYGKTVLEVGCGAGRFTEVLLALGAKVVALDFSGAVEACAAANSVALAGGRLVVAQADVFHLPVRERAFDIVVGYGMLQHTGDPFRALESLWARVCPGGLLLVDRYQFDIRHVLPFKYLARPITRRLQASAVLKGVEMMCRILVPLERLVLSRAQGNGPMRFVRYLLGRFPNSTFPLNLEAQGKLDRDMAWRWSVLDTFDQYAPRYDLPCTLEQWRKHIRRLPDGDVRLIGSMGQGNIAVVRRGRAR